MGTITVVIITKNEECNIERCLKSIHDWVDEIIIMDSHSTDRTPEICRSFDRVTFYDTDWLGYGATKNLGNSKAHSDYILSLDADEAISEELKQEILQLQPQLDGTTAFYLNRLVNYCGRWIYHSGWHPDYQLRLFPKATSHWNEAKVHEKVIVQDNTQTNRLKSPLYHYTYHTLSDHLERLNLYTSLDGERLAESKKNFLVIRGLISFFSRFLKHYFLKRGFLDGFEGFCIASLSAFAGFVRYLKAYHLRKGIR
ncbi:MAG: glycosyltransferase family 2 protein [Bdellovibrionales bacterium]|nr:glycosyltransferase family 2 protein [Bdellovibrionales bacterium]